MPIRKHIEKNSAKIMNNMQKKEKKMLHLHNKYLQKFFIGAKI